MGYTTTFEGRIEVTPPMKPDLVQRIQAHSELRHGGDTRVDDGAPGFWCDITASDDGTALVWNGSEKSYHMVEWTQRVIDWYLEPGGHVATGALRAFGESPGDIWALTVVDNVARRASARLTFEVD